MKKRNGGRDDDRPVLLIGVGRQRVGKTTLLNAVAQYYRAQGAILQVWNADLLNQTHSISKFHPDVLQCPVGTFDDTKAWLEERLSDQMAGRYDAVLDVGGGETALTRLAEEVQLVDTLEDAGIRPVALHLLGPELADLDYLSISAQNGLFSPAATLLVLNEGLVVSGRSSRSAFANVSAHPVFNAALERSAQVVMLPALGCMAQVTDRGLTFEEAAAGRQVEGFERTSLFDQARVTRWWRKVMPSFFEGLNPAWMPRVPALSREAAE